MVDHHIVPDADLAQEPWRCVGRVEASPPGAGGYQLAGTGTLVGPNLVLTASHILEGRYFGDGWRFRFVPAYKQGAQRRDPQSGARTSADFTGRVITGNPSGKPGASGVVNNVNGWDFVICELDDRLGDVWGHLGVWYPGKEHLISHRWTSVGYPQGLGGRNPIRFPGIDISDVESDKYNSREIQTDDYVTGDFGPGGNTFSPGWSGGPLLGVHQEAWWVVGVLSGFEPNGVLDLFNGEYVFASGPRLLDVHGQAHRDWLVAWTGWEHVGGAFKSAPAVVSWEPNRLDIFGVGMNDALYHKAWTADGWYPQDRWEELGGAFKGAPAVVSWEPNRLDIFGVDVNDAMYHKAWTGSEYYPDGPYWEPLGGAFKGAPAVVSWEPNRLDIFGVGLNDEMYHKAWTADGWYPSDDGWEPLGGAFKSAPAVVSWEPNRLDIFGVDVNDEMYHKAWGI